MVKRSRRDDLHNTKTKMKTAKVQKLLQKTANANGIEIDVITGAKKDIVLYGQDFRGFDVAISAGRDKSGSVNEISYVNYGADISSAYDDLFIFAEVDNAKKFVKDIGGSFSSFIITPDNLDSVASFVDSFRGVSPGEYSTYVSIGGGYDYSFA